MLDFVMLQQNSAMDYDPPYLHSVFSPCHVLFCSNSSGHMILLKKIDLPYSASDCLTWLFAFSMPHSNC